MQHSKGGMFLLITFPITFPIQTFSQGQSALGGVLQEYHDTTIQHECQSDNIKLLVALTMQKLVG
jgi:hypothetical protein